MASRPVGSGKSGKTGRKEQTKRRGHSSSSDSDESSGEYSSSTASGGDESVQSLVGSPNRTPQTARSNKRGIELPDQKVLLQDIEQFGGIEKARGDLTAFCDIQAGKSKNHSELYGAQYTKQRIRVENKIRVWQKLPPKHYNQVLEGLGVLPSTPHVKFSPVPGKIPKVKLKTSPGMPKPSSAKTSGKEKESQTKTSGKEKESQPKSPEQPTSIKQKTPAKMSRFEVKNGIVHGKCFVLIMHVPMAGSQLTPFVSH